MAKAVAAGWHKYADGTGGEVVGEQFRVPMAWLSWLWAISALLFLRPSSSICCVYCSGPEKKGGKFLWMVPLRCSRLAMADSRGVGGYGAFPHGMSLQVLVLPAHLGKTQYFYFRTCSIQEKVACAERGAFFTCFSLCDCQEIGNALHWTGWKLFGVVVVFMLT